MKPICTVFIFLELFCAAGILARNATAQGVTKPQAPVAPAFTKDTIVYVSDFELDAQDVKADKAES